MPDLKYVILWHDQIAQPHFDWMFETSPGSPLATWRAAVWPPTQTTLLERLPDHRADYLVFEGKLSKDRGQVHRVESGHCQIEATDNLWIIRLTDRAFPPSPCTQGEGRGEGSSAVPKSLTLRIAKTTGNSWQCSPIPPAPA
ncbi:MAG: hypothetical protein ABSH22_13190 [Tepidisphaeraceae bacterium]|jgi:hypothetical protein